MRASVPAQPTTGAGDRGHACAAPVTAAANEAAIKKATRKLQDKVDQLQTELQKSRTQYSSGPEGEGNAGRQLQETNSKLEKAQSELQKTQGAEKGSARPARAGAGVAEENPGERTAATERRQKRFGRRSRS